MSHQAPAVRPDPTVFSDRRFARYLITAESRCPLAQICRLRPKDSTAAQ